MDSKTIEFLRFPLIVGVIMIHAYNSHIYYNSDFLIFNHIQYIFSQILGRISVPLFFFFSGYLYFLGIEKMDRKIYIEKTRKRIKSILIPYIYFCTINIFIYKYFIGYPPLQNLTLLVFFKSYWNITNDSVPILYPLWYLRDLFILFLLSPFIYFLIKKIRISVIFIFLTCWYFDLISLIGFRGIGLFFFVSGAYLSINKLSFINLTKRISLFILIPVFLLFLFLDMNNLMYNSYVNKLTILLCMILVLILTSRFIQATNHRLPILISSASFFIYLTHVPLLHYINATFSYIFTPVTNLTLLFTYIFSITTTLFLTIILYLFLNYFYPQLLNWITGNR